VWHASVAGSAHLASIVKRRLALQALKGVGLEAVQWEEDRPMAYHIRRRLTDAESVLVGGVCDLRGSAEGWKRFERIKPLVPEIVHRMAIEELQQVTVSGDHGS
jgi:hypothetical protein